MKIKEFICSCIGLYGNCEYLDDIQENFNVELEVKAPMTVLFSKYQFEVIGNIHDNKELIKD